MAKKDAVVLESGEKIESIGPWTIAWRKFKQNRVAMAGLIVFVLIVVAVIVIPLMLGYSVNDYDLSNPNLAPGGEHLLGTDKQGRDCLFRLFLGTQSYSHYHIPLHSSLSIRNSDKQTQMKHYT